MCRYRFMQLKMYVYSVTSVLAVSAVAVGQPCQPGSFSVTGDEPCTYCAVGTY
jgi:hypothetical protein